MGSRISGALSTISVFALFIVLAASITAIGIRLTNPGIRALGPDSTAEQIVVQPGDTLWSIARTQVPEVDPRDVIAKIVKLNALGSAQIFPGQVLNVPSQKEYGPLQLAKSKER